MAAGYTGGILENKINSHELLNLNLKIQLNIISTAFEIGVKKLIFLVPLACILKKFATDGRD